MKLYLIQHAEATSVPDEPEKILSATGKDNIRKTAFWFGWLKPELDLIWHSGLKRARETAEILARILDCGVVPQTRLGLGPNDPVMPVKEELQRLEKNVVIVGHMPFLAKLAGLLLTENQLIQPVKFCNAGIVCISCWLDGCAVEWMVTPANLK